MSPVGLCLPGRARWPWVGAQSRGWPAPGPHRPPFPPAARLGLPGSISGHLFASTGDTIDSPEPCCSPAGHTGPSRFTRGPTAGGPSPALPDSIQEPPGKTRPAEHGCLQSQPPAHPQPGPREWMGGAGGAAGEAGLGPGRARRVRGGPTGSAVEKGAPGQLKDTCALLGCGRRREPQGSPHLPSASPKWETLGQRIPPAGAQHPQEQRCRSQERGALSHPAAPSAAARAWLTPAQGLAGWGSGQPPSHAHHPCPVFPGGPLSDRRTPRPRGTKVGCGGAKPAPRPGHLARKCNWIIKGSDYLALERVPRGS